MRLIKYSHACVRLEKDQQALVLDPGTFSEVDQALAGANAILITHEHPDHVDNQGIRKALESNIALEVWAPISVSQQFAEFGERITTVEPKQSFDAAGFHVTTHGGQHALIHSSIPVVPNVGYLIDELVYHPGDSFWVPAVSVHTLLTPMHAPWSKFSEVADFLIAVRPKQAFQVHDALLSDIGKAIVVVNIDRVTGDYGINFRMLFPTESVEL